VVVWWWCGGGGVVVVVWWCGGVVDLWSHFFCSVPFHSLSFPFIPFHSLSFPFIPFHSLQFPSIPFHSFFVSVGRSPTFVRNAHGLPVHDFLFASRHEYEDKKKLLLADDRRKRNMNFNKSHVTELSSKLINHARRRKR
jgi:hypothetical protein